jgi:hypothetical protein
VPESPTDRPSTVASRMGTTVLQVADWLIVVLFNKLGSLIVAVTAVYVAVRAFDDSPSDGTRAVICFLIPTLWGAFGLTALAGERRPFETLGKWAMPVLGVIAGVVISLGILAEAPVWTTNLGLGVMEAFYFMIFLSGDAVPSRLREPLEREWTLALLLMVTVVSVTAAITA